MSNDIDSHYFSVRFVKLNEKNAGRQQGKMKAKETARAFNIQKPLA